MCVCVLHGVCDVWGEGGGGHGAEREELERGQRLGAREVSRRDVHAWSLLGNRSGGLSKSIPA